MAGLGVLRHNLLSGAMRTLIFISVLGTLVFVMLLYYTWGETSGFYAGLTTELYGALLTVGILTYITSIFDNRQTTLDDATIEAIATRVAEKLQSADSPWEG